ncbi:MAG TPA: preprotein translocase subunit YajC [Candidatus Angelobacter sp.]|jgi:preprotein translocase subunit YajC|nr:preprotein translocase subunit YajC [Candidatus Angelobacter sp.]
MIQSVFNLYLFQAPGGGASMLFFFAILLGATYFMAIRPQQTRQKRWQAMVNDLKAGDKITTSGGIRGTIIAVKDDAFHLRVPPDNLRLEIAKSAVLSVSREDEPKK